MGLFTQRRDPEPVRIISSVTVEIARPPDEVMGFLMEPKSAIAIGPLSTRAFRAPDTPVRAVGEQHVMCWQEPDGAWALELHEIVELDFPTRAVTRVLTTPGDLRVAYLCEPIGESGTSYTQAASITVPEHVTGRALQQAYDEETRRSTARIKEILENEIV